MVLGPRTLVMGVLNVTPDSFSDGGLSGDPARAIDLAQAMESAGADLIDVGAESTRPGAAPVAAAEEIERLRPVLKTLVHRLRVPLSIDTYKAETAAFALAEGASIVNDISGLEYDRGLGPVLASCGVPVVLMHTRGRPDDMYARASYDDVVVEVSRELEDRIQRAIGFGIAREQIVLDPGLGFGKRAEQSLKLLAGVHALAALGRPLLIGASRKSFMNTATGPLEPAARDWPSAAAVSAAVYSGAHIVRVHRVAEMVQVVRVADAIRAAALG
ncbi:MAG: dihydropteroate synthase [Vicinamibacterales bacterium]